jgi:nucleotide-binding universal stress UspA family protein
MKVDTIVVGYDASENARLALDAAIDLASDSGVVHVVTAYTAASEEEILRQANQLSDEYKSNVDPLAGPSGNLRFAEKILEKRGLEHVGHLVEEQPAAAILDVADEVDADMIIVGSRGLGRGTRLLRGSVSTRVAGHAKTSFMVIHHNS